MLEWLLFFVFTIQWNEFILFPKKKKKTEKIRLNFLCVKSGGCELRVKWYNLLFD